MGAVDKSALIRWRLGRLEGRADERIGPEAKRVLVQSNLRAAGLGMAVRGKEHPPTTRKIEDRGGWLRPMKRREASRTARQRWIENYCSHGLHANWIIKFSASVVSASAPPRPLSPYFAYVSRDLSTACARPLDDFVSRCRIPGSGFNLTRMPSLRLKYCSNFFFQSLISTIYVSL